MLFKSSTLLAFGVSAILASPLQRRQETSTSAVETTGAASTTGTDAAASSTTAATTASGASDSLISSPTVEPTASGTSTALTVSGSDTTAISSIQSALSSVASSAAQATTAVPAPTSGGQYAGTCEEGYSLSYAIATVEYPDVELETAVQVLSNWTSAVPSPIEISSSEGEGVGATRSWTLGNVSVSETLVNQTESPETGSLNQIWNTTAPINVSESLIISSATNVLNLYTNTTSNNATTIQYFANFCSSSQPAGLELYSQVLTAYLTGVQGLFTGSNSTASNTTAAAAGSTAPASTTALSSSVASQASSAVASPTSAAGSVASQASSAAAQPTSALGGAASSALSGVSSVVGQATSGGIGGISTAIGGLTSGVGALTSVI